MTNAGVDNETVDGVEFPNFPKSLESRTGEDERLVIADMSSNFLSRRIPINKYAVIFGGAQKNIGTPLVDYSPEIWLGSRCSQYWFQGPLYSVMYAVLISALI